MKKTSLNKLLERREIFVFILLVLIILFLIRPIIVIGDYSLLQTWDTWNHYVFAKVIVDAGGIIPNWYYIELFPIGRPFLYPPLAPLIFAWASIITGIELFTIVKTITYFSYLLFGLLFLKFVSILKDKKIIILSTILLLTTTQLFDMAINNFAQMIEMCFYLGIIYFLWKKSFLPTAILFILAIYTHFATPLFFALFLILLIIFDKTEWKLYFKTFFVGLTIGSFWLVRYLFYFDWIQPNYLMAERQVFGVWIWRLSIEGFSFFILILFLVMFFAMNKEIFKKFFSKRLNKLLLLYTIAFIPAFYYPERAITYVCFPIIIFCVQIFVKYFKKSLLPILIASILGVAWLKIFSLKPFGSVFFYVPGTLFFVFLTILILSLIFVLIYINKNKKLEAIISKIFFTIFILLLFFNPASYGIIDPINSWFYSLNVKMQIPEEANEGFAWLAENYPTAITLSPDTRMNCLGIHHGLKTTSIVVMEFGKKGMNYPHEKYVTHLTMYREIEGEEQAIVWQKGFVYFYDVSKMKNFDPKLFNPYG